MELFRNNDSIFMQISLVVKKRRRRKKTTKISEWSLNGRFLNDAKSKGLVALQSPKHFSSSQGEKKPHDKLNPDSVPTQSQEKGKENGVHVYFSFYDFQHPRLCANAHFRANSYAL